MRVLPAFVQPAGWIDAEALRQPAMPGVVLNSEIEGDGDPLIRQIHFKVFTPGNKTVLRKIDVRAPAGKHFTVHGIDQVLDRFVDKLDSELRGHKYRMIVVGPASFNFVWDESLPGSTWTDQVKAYVRRMQAA